MAAGATMTPRVTALATARMGMLLMLPLATVAVHAEVGTGAMKSPGTVYLSGIYRLSTFSTYMSVLYSC